MSTLTAPASPTGTAATASSPSASTASGKAIAENFTQFLNLLTTQLKNQNPMEPLNTNEFTQQLVQFASVEQQLKSNQTLDSLLKATQTSNTTSALGFVGKQVSADSVLSGLSKGSAQWQISSPRAANATITISDQAGRVVQTLTKALRAGDQDLIWDGRQADGGIAADGVYSIAVSAKDSSGQPLTVKASMVGIVDGVNFDADGTTLSVNGTSLPLSAVKTLRTPR